ncbi:hypothetical protein KUTeg_020316 [Tegillarca granosa]|uniref:Uncharacterized protein n=1 Tax=Tegillarca granosa TaxID=220873 RepID=A0ABQ9E7K9_TEGGR|nr:hypothetical protein KUTeg_020316 [Tegillarca granosa]
MYIKTSVICLCFLNIFSDGVLCFQCLFKRRNQTAISCSTAINTGKNCTSSKLQQLYPELYGQKLWPSRPHLYKLQPFDRQLQNGYYNPGIKVTLSPPNTASVISVKGFELNFHDIKDPRIEAQQCLIIDLRNITLTADDRGFKSNVTVDIYPSGEKNFIFDIFSLPKPPPDKITSDLHYHSFLKTGKNEWGMFHHMIHCFILQTAFVKTEHRNVLMTASQL